MCTLFLQSIIWYGERTCRRYQPPKWMTRCEDGAGFYASISASLTTMSRFRGACSDRARTRIATTNGASCYPASLSATSVGSRRHRPSTGSWSFVTATRPSVILTARQACGSRPVSRSTAPIHPMPAALNESGRRGGLVSAVPRPAKALTDREHRRNTHSCGREVRWNRRGGAFRVSDGPRTRASRGPRRRSRARPAII